MVYRKGADRDRILDARKHATIVDEDGDESLARSGDLFVKRTKPRRARSIWKNAHGLRVRHIPTIAGLPREKR